MKGAARRRQSLQLLATATSLAILVAACGGQPVPDVSAGIDGCANCGMVIDRVNEAAGWIEAGDFVPFCSPGCLLADYDNRRGSGGEVPSSIFFADHRDGTFSSASDTAFLLTDHVPTVMNARVVCYNSVVAAEAARQHDDEIVTDWTGYRVARGAPDTVIATVFGPEGMEPEVVVASMGDIVLWRLTARGLADDLSFRIKGYPEIEPSLVEANGTVVELRFMATRPGAGFPVENADTGAPLGMLKVEGAHTADEAAS